MPLLEVITEAIKGGVHGAVEVTANDNRAIDVTRTMGEEGLDAVARFRISLGDKNIVNVKNSVSEKRQ